MDDAEKKNRAAFALIVGDGDEGEEVVEVVLNASLSALRFGMFWRPGAFGPRKLEVLDDPPCLEPQPRLSACMSAHNEDSVAAQLAGLDLGNLYGSIDKQK